MSRKVRSSRGVEVDFDQLIIKQQLASAPSTAEVKAREDFVERRLKRRTTKKLVQQVTEQLDQETKVEDNEQPRKQQQRK